MDSPSISKSTKRGSAVMWLSYTAFIFIEPIFEPSLRMWLQTLGVFVIFLGIFYVYVSTCKDSVRYWVIAATFALGLVTFPWNGGGDTFFVYAAGFFPFSIPSKRWTLAFFAFECLACLAEARWTQHTMMNGYMGAFLILTIGIGNIFFAEQRRADGKLRMANEEIEALAALAERERIARDLHDVLGHTLSVIVLKAELAGRLIPLNPERAATEIADVERTARTALAEVREAIGGYRARGLAAEIEAARRTLDSAGVTLIAEATTAGGALTATEETVLALALREAVTNIVRHARARTCRLRFVTDHGHRRLLIEDDGGDSAQLREGNGLRGMRERIESIGGHLSLERERGTRLLIDLPLRPEAV